MALRLIARVMVPHSNRAIREGEIQREACNIAAFLPPLANEIPGSFTSAESVESGSLGEWPTVPGAVSLMACKYLADGQRRAFREHERKILRAIELLPVASYIIHQAVLECRMGRKAARGEQRGECGARFPCAIASDGDVSPVWANA
jgi:hypothetical protein